MVVIQHANSYWLEFDGWALSNGFDPLELPCRRFFSAVWRWMTEGLDEKQIKELHGQLDQSVYATNNATAQARKNAAKEKEPDEKENKIIPLKPFQAPPGWTPPGWSEESAYANSVAGMRGVTSTGGGKIGGAIKKK